MMNASTCPSLPCGCMQALQYLKKVCNHPRLVLDKHNKEERHAAVWEEFRGKEESLNDIEHAAKFLSLK